MRMKCEHSEVFIHLTSSAILRRVKGDMNGHLTVRTYGKGVDGMFCVGSGVVRGGFQAEGTADV